MNLKDLERLNEYARRKDVSSRKKRAYKELDHLLLGRDGEHGRDGRPGELGPKGTDGLDGEIGPRGSKGEDGDPGLDGHDGSDGLDGQDGLGINGKDGKDGPIGKTGKEGKRGITGGPGIAGSDGYPGIPGADGKDGKDGKRGERGERGIQGMVGPKGEKGDMGQAKEAVTQIIAGGTPFMPRNARDQVTSPGVGDDQERGFLVGSRWWDTTNNKEYVCMDKTTGAAVWKETTGSGSGVTGPGTSTDEAIARWNGAGGAAIQDTGLTISDTDVLNMGLNEFINVKFENLGALPGAGTTGRLIYLTTDNHLYLDQG